MKEIVTAILLCISFSTVDAQTQDTLYTSRPLFVAGDALLAAGFIGAAAAAAPDQQELLASGRVDDGALAVEVRRHRRGMPRVALGQTGEPDADELVARPFLGAVERVTDGPRVDRQVAGRPLEHRAGANAEGRDEDQEQRTHGGTQPVPRRSVNRAIRLGA